MGLKPLNESESVTVFKFNCQSLPSVRCGQYSELLAEP